MKKTSLIPTGIIAALLAGILHAKSLEFLTVDVVPKEEWGARPPVLVEKMINPVPYVVIHHSYIPGACHNDSECKASMRSMQRFHQISNGWSDIGYSFAVGGNGEAYEGRGWSAIGTHAPGYNNQSIGICLIGDWRYDLPPENQLNKVKDLIKYGVNMGYIRKNFQLLGHREVRNTECPGDALFNLVKQWRKKDGTMEENIFDNELIATV